MFRRLARRLVSLLTACCARDSTRPCEDREKPTEKVSSVRQDVASQTEAQEEEEIIREKLIRANEELQRCSCSFDTISTPVDGAVKDLLKIAKARLETLLTSEWRRDIHQEAAQLVVLEGCLAAVKEVAINLDMQPDFIAGVDSARLFVSEAKAARL